MKEQVRKGSVLRNKRKWMKTKSNVSSKVCFLLLITIIIYYNVGNIFVIYCRLICESFTVFTEFQPSVPPANVLPPWTSIQTLCYLCTLTISRIKGFFFFGSMWIPPLCFIRSPTGSGMFTLTVIILTSKQLVHTSLILGSCLLCDFSWKDVCRCPFTSVKVLMTDQKNKNKKERDSFHHL